MQVRNALIVGGQRRLWTPLFEYLATCNVQVFDVWHEEKSLRSKLPRNVDVVIVLSSLVSHALQKHAQAEAEALARPVIYSSHNIAKFPEALRKWGITPAQTAEPHVEPVIEREPERSEPAFPIEQFKPMAKISIIDVESGETEKDAEARHQTDAAPTAAPVEEQNNMAKKVDEKTSFVIQLLAKDPAMLTEEVLEAVSDKFKQSISKKEVAGIRWDEHGLKYGPGGRLFDKKGNRMKDLEKGSNGPKARKSSSDEALCAIIGCDKPTKSKGFCVNHYQKARTMSLQGILPASWKDPAPQSIDDVIRPRGRAAHKGGVVKVTTPQTNGHATNGHTVNGNGHATYSTPPAPKMSVPRAAEGLRALSELLAQVRDVMKQEGINDVYVPIDGNITVHRSVETSIEL